MPAQTTDKPQNAGMPGTPQNFTLERNGRKHQVTMTPMPKGRIMKIHTADGRAWAATAVRPAEEPARAAEWMLNNHELFKNGSGSA